MGFGVVHLILPAITRAFYAVYTAGIGFDVQERSTVQYVDSLNMEYVIFSCTALSACTLGMATSAS